MYNLRFLRKISFLNIDIIVTPSKCFATFWDTWNTRRFTALKYGFRRLYDPSAFEYAGLSVPDSSRCTLLNFNGSSLSKKRAENGPGSSSGSGYVNTLIARMCTACRVGKRDEARRKKRTKHAVLFIIKMKNTAELLSGFQQNIVRHSRRVRIKNFENQ